MTVIFRTRALGKKGERTDSQGSQSKQTTALWPNRRILPEQKRRFLSWNTQLMETWLGCEAADLREEEAQAGTRQQTTEHTQGGQHKGTVTGRQWGYHKSHHVGRPERVLLTEKPNEASWNRRKEN